MLADRLKTTLTAAQDELNAATAKRDVAKAALKKQLTTDLAAIDAQYRKKAKHLRALMRALEADAPADKPPEPPAK